METMRRVYPIAVFLVPDELCGFRKGGTAFVTTPMIEQMREMPLLSVNGSSSITKWHMAALVADESG